MNRQVCQAAITAAVLARMEGGGTSDARLAALPIVEDLDVSTVKDDVAGLCSLVASIVIELGAETGEDPTVALQKRFLRMEGGIPPEE